MTTLVFQQRLVAWIWLSASMDKKFLYGLEVKHLSWFEAQAVSFKLCTSYEFFEPNFTYYLIDFNELIFEYCFIEVYWVSLTRFWQQGCWHRSTLCEKRPGAVAYQKQLVPDSSTWFQPGVLVFTHKLFYLISSSSPVEDGENGWMSGHLAASIG